MTRTLSECLRTARSVTVLTGAGVSAESGLATFRDPLTGLWAKYRAEDLATPQAFRRNPKLVWEWYAWRRERAEEAFPNPAHRALAEMERLVPQFQLITQNVDGLHQRAGSSGVIELHGSLTRFRCSWEDTPVEQWQETGDVPPRCPRCSEPLRPDIVWFGEMLPPGALDAAMAAARACDVFLSIGTSGKVYPAASLITVASGSGAAIGIINPDTLPGADPAWFQVAGPAGEVLPALIDAAWPDWRGTTG